MLVYLTVLSCYNEFDLLPPFTPVVFGIVINFINVNKYAYDSYVDYALSCYVFCKRVRRGATRHLLLIRPRKRVYV